MRSSGRSAATQKKGIAGRICDCGSEVARGTRDGVLGPASIVLIDDDLIVLSRLREIIQQDPDLAVVAACRCAAGAMLAVQKYRPAIVVLDVRLPDRDGAELIYEITTTSEAKVIVFTAALQKQGIVSVLQSGAEAIVFKDQQAAALVSCVRSVLAGERWIPRDSATREGLNAGVCGRCEGAFATRARSCGMRSGGGTQ